MAGKRGYCGIAVYDPKDALNIGSLLRTSQAFGVDFIATIGFRYKAQVTDTSHAPNHVPCFGYTTYESFLDNLPYSPWDKAGVQLVAVDLVEAAVPLETFVHPERAIYIFGGEDITLPQAVLKTCDYCVKICTREAFSLNLSVAGSVVVYDRMAKQHSTMSAP